MYPHQLDDGAISFSVEFESTSPDLGRAYYFYYDENGGTSDWLRSSVLVLVKGIEPFTTHLSVEALTIRAH